MRAPRISPKTYRYLTLAALCALTVIVITGGAVRLTGSGLGCPDWPTCAHGTVVPERNFHSWIESANRLFTGMVSIAVIAAALGALWRTPRRRDLTWLAFGLVGGLVAQIVLGGLTVWYKLAPGFVMAHFLLSMVIVLDAVVLHHRAGQPPGPSRPAVHRDYLWLGRAVVALAAGVLLVGTMVTGSGPHGGDQHVRRLGFKPHDITRVHSSLVWILVALVALTVWRLWAAGASATLIRRAEVLLGLLLAQGSVGYIQYFYGLPIGLVAIHIAGAVCVWIASIRLVLAMHERLEPIDLAIYDGPANP